MSARTLVSLSASVLITAGVIASLACTGQPSALARTTIDGMPVITLPGMTVQASPLPATANAAAPTMHTVAMASDTSFMGRLLADSEVQVASSHLNMPYYAFGSSIEQISKD